jgi:hypothetical protein
VVDEAAAVQERREERDWRLKTAKLSVEQEESSMRRGR